MSNSWRTHAGMIDIPAGFRQVAQRHGLGDLRALTAFATSDPQGVARSWTRSELARDVSVAARAFSEMGLGEDDRIAILLPNVPEYHVVLWGGMATCAVAPINPLLRINFALHLLKSVAPAVLVGPSRALDPALWSTAQALARDNPSMRLLEVGPEATFWSDLRMDDQGRGLVPRPAGGVAALFHTGGTTGRPRIARLSLANVAAVVSMLQETIEFRAADNFVCPLPLFHVAGAIFGGLSAFLSGTHVVMPAPAGLRDKNVQKHFWKLLEHVNATMLVAVPSSLVALTAVPIDADLRSLNYVVTGTTPLPIETARRFTQHTGKPIHIGYGMTETAGGIAYTPRRSPARPEATGPPLPGLEIRIVPLMDQPETGSSEPQGRVLVRGPNVFMGYLDEQNESVDANGWLDTGDLGFVDARGWLTLTGRSKDLIIRGGHNIDPASIEDVAHSHEAVALAAAVGEIDAYAGEIPVLFVELRSGYDEQAAVIELTKLLAEGISEPPARPRSIYVVDRMPLTAIGKVFKPTLRVESARKRVESILKSSDVGGATVSVDVAAGGILRVMVESHGDSEAEHLRKACRELELFNIAVYVDGKKLEHSPSTATIHDSENIQT
jgi:fatty-acyl-CoA synthase